MTFHRVAVLAPGDMGHAIGRMMVEGGLRVVTCLAGRSDRTRALAGKAGIEDLGSLESVLDTAEVVMSVLPPSRSIETLEALAAAAQGAAGRPYVWDLNAVSPETARRGAEIAAAAGLIFIDGGIIGGPPHPGRGSPRLYASGEEAPEMMRLVGTGLDVRALEGGIGAASAIKMCYASLTKGLTAIATQSFTAAARNGVAEALIVEMESSQSALLSFAERFVPSMPPKAYRWVGEMEEIADTFEAAGFDRRMFDGAAEVWRKVERSPLGSEVVEARTAGTSLLEVVRLLAEMEADET